MHAAFVSLIHWILIWTIGNRIFNVGTWSCTQGAGHSNNESAHHSWLWKTEVSLVPQAGIEPLTFWSLVHWANLQPQEGTEPFLCASFQNFRFSVAEDPVMKEYPFERPPLFWGCFCETFLFIFPCKLTAQQGGWFFNRGHWAIGQGQDGVKELSHWILISITAVSKTEVNKLKRGYSVSTPK